MNRRFSLFSLGLALLLSACGGPDGEKISPSSISRSGGATVALSGSGTLLPFSPRDGGFFDLNRADEAALAVRNPNGAKTTLTYDFELYADPSLSELVEGVSVVAIDTSHGYTEWRLSSSLTPGAYYWRVRSSDQNDWSGPFGFEVRSFCDIANQPTNATWVIDHLIPRSCPSITLNDPTAALGPPDAIGGTNPGDPPYANFLSLDYGGYVDLEMGATIVDGAGDDLRVWEYVSTELLEVFVAKSETGPWVSLGVAWCPEYCDFDLALAGVDYARFVRVSDMWSHTYRCHSTSGADIDSVEVLNSASSLGQCQ